MSVINAIIENGKEFSVSVGKNNEWLLYWDGESWITVGYHYDVSRVIQKDEFEGQWKIDAKLFCHNIYKVGSNELLDMIDKFLVARKTGEIVDKWCEDLYDQIEQGYPEPDWSEYPLGTSYYNCQMIENRK